MIQKQIILNNLLVNYYMTEEAPAAAPTVIFLHGWRSSAQIWTPVYENLKMEELALYALDLPGFGKSPLPPGAWTLGDYASLVKNFIERLHLKAVCLVGHSFGGRVAIKVAVEFPDRANKLVLVDGGGFRANVVRRGLVTFFAKVLKPIFAFPLFRRLRPRIYNLLGADDYLATPELKPTFLNVIREDILNLAARVSQKTLIFWGENDREAPLDYGKTLHHKIQNSQFVIFPKAGHFSFLDHPDEFSKVLIQFLNESV